MMQQNFTNVCILMLALALLIGINVWLTTELFVICDDLRAKPLNPQKTPPPGRLGRKTGLALDVATDPPDVPETDEDPEDDPPTSKGGGGEVAKGKVVPTTVPEVPRPPPPPPLSPNPQNATWTPHMWPSFGRCNAKTDSSGWFRDKSKCEQALKEMKTCVVKACLDPTSATFEACMQDPLSAGCTINSDHACKPNRYGDNRDSYKKQIETLHNCLRATEGLPPLKWSETLERASLGRASKVCDNKFFDHPSGALGGSHENLGADGPVNTTLQFWSEKYPETGNIERGHYHAMKSSRVKELGCASRDGSKRCPELALYEGAGGRGTSEPLICSYL
jgi:hypothetical protein